MVEGWLPRQQASWMGCPMHAIQQLQNGSKHLQFEVRCQVLTILTGQYLNCVAWLMVSEIIHYNSPSIDQNT